MKYALVILMALVAVPAVADDDGMTPLLLLVSQFGGGADEIPSGLPTLPQEGYIKIWNRFTTANTSGVNRISAGTNALIEYTSNFATSGAFIASGTAAATNKAYHAEGWAGIERTNGYTIAVTLHPTVDKSGDERHIFTEYEWSGVTKGVFIRGLAGDVLDFFHFHASNYRGVRRSASAYDWDVVNTNNYLMFAYDGTNPHDSNAFAIYHNGIQIDNQDFGTSSGTFGAPTNKLAIGGSFLESSASSRRSFEDAYFNDFIYWEGVGLTSNEVYSVYTNLNANTP